jgi:aspartyl-tRNA(Asn)/glutamyl-tRNA(Gln) amidotransferase subunit A
VEFFKLPPGSHPDLTFLSIEDASRLLRRRRISPVELADAALKQIEAWNPRLNAFITVLGGEARRAARAAERRLRRNPPRSPLFGIPISLKDNIYTKGIRTTAGSEILRNFVPDFDSAIAGRLAQSGAILLGKTNLHEFAYGITSENSHFGAARNPWANDRITGGSSGGSAASVAAGMGFASVGTDTAGSIRIPPAFCGVVGLKPTIGLVDLTGVVPLSTTCDHAGFIGRSVADVCILFEACRPAYPKDVVRPDFRKLQKSKPRRFRVGWPEQHFFDIVDEEVRKKIDGAAKLLESLGATIERVSLPHAAESVQAGTTIQMSEATHYHQSQGFFPGRAADYEPDISQRLAAGAEIKATDYLKAFEMKRIVEQEFDAAFEEVDAIIAPSSPIPAPLLGQTEVEVDGKKEGLRPTLVRANRPANVSGNPAIALPCGFTETGLPVGMQLMGPRWGEAKLLAIAAAYEDATNWNKRHPV